MSENMITRGWGSNYVNSLLHSVIDLTLYFNGLCDKLKLYITIANAAKDDFKEVVINGKSHFKVGELMIMQETDDYCLWKSVRN